jgi:alpha-mannosidase
MVQRLDLIRDVDGLCRVSFAGPDEFFDAAAAFVKTDGAAALPVWRGELYLELHRGTLTSQQQLKKLNRRCEQALHDAEAAAALALAYGASSHEAWRLDAAWKDVLLNQFHDVLPGSCTAEVVVDASTSYSKALSAAAAVMVQACSSAGSSLVIWEKDHLRISDATLAAATIGITDGAQSDSSASAIVVFNSLSVERCELVCVPSYFCSPSVSQAVQSSSQLQWIMCKSSPFSLAPIRMCTPPPKPVSVSKAATGFLLQHSTLQVIVNNVGVIVSCLIWDSTANVWRESVKAGGSVGKLQLFKDVPLFWDAWDVEFYYESEQLQEVVCCGGCVVDSGPLLCSVRFDAKIGQNSRAEVVYSVHANDPFVRLRLDVHWNESHSLLRISFDTSVDADDWLADSQFSIINRSSRRNTSWDRAKFEAAGHKWIAVREHGMTVAVINDCTYGHSCLGGTLSSSLLRSSTHPDPSADRGFHVFNMAFMPSPAPSAVELVVAAARSFNAPLRLLKVPNVHADDAGQLAPLELGFVSSCSHVIVDTVKLPFAWAAAKMRFGCAGMYQSPGEAASVSSSGLPPAAFVTPPNSANPADARADADGLSPSQPRPSTPRSPVDVSPFQLEPSSATPHSASNLSSSALLTPPHDMLPSPVAGQFNTPVNSTPGASTHPSTPVLDVREVEDEEAKAPRAPPPGTCVIIVRVFEAAGGVAPAVCLRSERR